MNRNNRELHPSVLFDIPCRKMCRIWNVFEVAVVRHLCSRIFIADANVSALVDRETLQNRTWYNITRAHY